MSGIRGGDVTALTVLTYVCWDVQLRDDSHSSALRILYQLPHLSLSVDHLLTVGPVLTEAGQVRELDGEALGVRQVPVEHVQLAVTQTGDYLEMSLRLPCP